MFAILKYESVLLAGPIHTASSASLTCNDSLSASEYTATVDTPNSLAALIILTAISPLFAISIFLNINPPKLKSTILFYLF